MRLADLVSIQRVLETRVQTTERRDGERNPQDGRGAPAQDYGQAAPPKKSPERSGARWDTLPEGSPRAGASSGDAAHVNLPEGPAQPQHGENVVAFRHFQVPGHAPSAQRSRTIGTSDRYLGWYTLGARKPVMTRDKPEGRRYIENRS